MVPSGIHHMIRLDSSGNDTSNSDAVCILIIFRLSYPGSCGKRFSLTLAACRVFLFHPVAFSDSCDYVLGSHRVSIKISNSSLVAQTINHLCLRRPDQ